ncbi:MAG: Hpt domain-containing protein [Mangrovicoccus sp.]|nr:Hpt domain-containing protein [Mangrovicoccus sp.]
MIDWTRVEALREEVGPEEFGEVVELFLEEVDDMIEQISVGRGGSAEEDMHFLKGAAMNLGFADFSSLCQKAESLARSGQAEEIDLALVFDTYESTREHFLQEAASKSLL